MDEVDILFEHLRLLVPELIPESFNNDEHRFGHTKFTFSGRGLLLKYKDTFHKIMLVDLNDTGDLSISIIEVIDGVVFIDSRTKLDIYAPDFMARVVNTLKLYHNELHRYYLENEALNVRLNTLVSNH